MIEVSKGLLPLLRIPIASQVVFPQSQKHSKSALPGCFFMFLTGFKGKNSPESKLLLNYRPFDPGIIE